MSDKFELKRDGIRIWGGGWVIADCSQLSGMINNTRSSHAHIPQESSTLAIHTFPFLVPAVAGHRIRPILRLLGESFGRIHSSLKSEVRLLHPDHRIRNTVDSSPSNMRLMRTLVRVDDGRMIVAK